MSPDNPAEVSVTPTVKEVCVLSGPAYGQCWGCPVMDCVLRVDPNTITALGGVALKAAQALNENRIVVEGLGGRSLLDDMPGDTQFEPQIELSLFLATQLNEPGVKRRLQVWTAAEAAVLRVPALRAALTKAEDQYLREWMRAYEKADRTPTDAEVLARDARVDRLEASIAAQVYGVPGDVDAVREAISWLKGHNLRPTLEYRRDHAR